MRSGTHGIVRGDRRHDRRAVAFALAQLGGATGVELGGHEHRAALGVEVEHFGCVGGQQEPVLQRPLPDLVTTARSTVMSSASISVSSRISTSAAARAVAAVVSLPHRQVRRDFLGQALQSPIACRAATFVGTSGSGTMEPTDSPSPENWNARHVALDTVVIGGERRRAHQLDRPVLADEPTARSSHPHRRQQRPPSHRQLRPDASSESPFTRRSIHSFDDCRPGSVPTAQDRRRTTHGLRSTVREHGDVDVRPSVPASRRVPRRIRRRRYRRRGVRRLLRQPS